MRDRLWIHIQFGLVPKKIETLPMALEDDCEAAEFSALSPLLTLPFLSTNFVFVVHIIIIF